MAFFKQLVTDNQGNASSSKVISLFVTVLLGVVVIILLIMIPSFAANTDKEFVAMANSNSLMQILSTIVQLAAILAALAGTNYAVTTTSNNNVAKAAIQSKIAEADPNRLSPLGDNK